MHDFKVDTPTGSEKNPTAAKYFCALSYGLCSHGLYSCDLYSSAYAVMDYTVMACTVMAHTVAGSVLIAYVVRGLNRGGDGTARRHSGPASILVPCVHACLELRLFHSLHHDYIGHNCIDHKYSHGYKYQNCIGRGCLP